LATSSRTIAAILLTAATFSTTNAAETAKIGDLEYSLEVIKTQYTTHRKATVIPSTETDGYKNLTSVTIPYEVTYENNDYPVESIGDNAFVGCSRLVDILPAENSWIGVRTIGDNAFAGCISLRWNPFDTWVRTVGVRAFSGCVSIKDLSINEGTEVYINERAFEGCTGLTSVTIPACPGGIEMSYIKDYAFDGCSNLKSFIFDGDTPINLSEHALDGTNNCPIYVPKEYVEKYKAAWPQYAGRIVDNGVPDDEIFTYTYNLDGTALLYGFRQSVNSSELVSLTIPEKTTKAGVEYTVTGFDPYGMNFHMGLYLPNLKELIIKAKFKAFTGTGGINEYPLLERVELPDGLETLTWNTFQRTKLTSVRLPLSLKTIQSNVFYECSLLTYVTIPSGVTSIEESAFNGCSSLNEIRVMAKTPPTLGANAFDGSTCPIVVPHASTEQYLADEGWKIYADRIVSDTEIPMDFPISSDNLEIKVGENHKLSVLRWESSDPTVATVDEDGNITAVGEGEALITATLLDGSGRTGCLVTITAIPSGTEAPSVEIDNSRITAVHDLNGILILGSGATHSDLRSLPSGIYIVTTRSGSYKIRI